MKKPQVQPQDKYIVRMPDGLRERIKTAAERNGRSMNAEIVSTLEEAYPEQAEDFGTMFLGMFDDLNALADAGRERDLTNRIQLMNHRLAAAGHGRIQFYLIKEANALSVGSRNIKAQSGLDRLEEAVRKKN